MKKMRYVFSSTISLHDLQLNLNFILIDLEKSSLLSHFQDEENEDEEGDGEEEGEEEEGDEDEEEDEEEEEKDEEVKIRKKPGRKPGRKPGSVNTPRSTPGTRGPKRASAGRPRGSGKTRPTIKEQIKSAIDDRDKQKKPKIIATGTYTFSFLK